MAISKLNLVGDKVINDNILKLVNEVKNREHEMDVLSDDFYDLSGEAQAIYFSKMRDFMNTNIAHIIFCKNQQLGELAILKRLEKRR